MPSAPSPTPIGPVLALLVALACQSREPRREPPPPVERVENPSQSSPTPRPEPDSGTWRIFLEVPREDGDGGIVFCDEGTASDQGAAVEAAVAAALASASRVRDSQVRSAIEVRDETLSDRQLHEVLALARVDSRARFSGYRELDREVRPAEEGYRARVRLRLERAQVFVGEELLAIWEQPRERWADELAVFVRRAASRRDSDAQVLGLSQRLAVAPDLETVLELAKLQEEAGLVAAAHRLTLDWIGRVPDPNGALASRATRLERDLADPSELVTRLLLGLDGARAEHTRLTASSDRVERTGPLAKLHLNGRVREGYPISFIWIDGASIAAPADFVLQARDVHQRFECKVVDWNDERAGYVPGRVRLVVLAGDRSDPAPRLEPEVPLGAAGARTSSADRDRLRRFVAEVQAWVRRGTNEALVLDWQQL